VWLGTFGNGIYKVDPLFVQSTHEPFGLLDRGAGALALAADGVWIAGMGNGSAPRAGLTFATFDLQQWRWLEGAFNRPILGARAWDLEVRGQQAWVATDRGLMRMDTRNENDVEVWTATDGLPSDLAYAVVTRPSGAWVGTARGAVRLTEEPGARGRARLTLGRTVALGVPVHALLLTGDTLWIGSDAGLLVMARGDSAPRRPRVADDEPRLRQPISALARSDSVLVATTRDDVFRLTIPGGTLLPRYDAVRLDALRGITSVEADARTIWVTGAGGVLVIQRGSGLGRLLAAPGEIPGEAYDVALDAEFGWIATRAGLLRVRRLGDGSPR
jgi:ligand-binding sensor domain-containing protein